MVIIVVFLRGEGGGYDTPMDTMVTWLYTFGKSLHAARPI